MSFTPGGNARADGPFCLDRPHFLIPFWTLILSPSLYFALTPYFLKHFWNDGKTIVSYWLKNIWRSLKILLIGHNFCWVCLYILYHCFIYYITVAYIFFILCHYWIYLISYITVYILYHCLYFISLFIIYYNLYHCLIYLITDKQTDRHLTLYDFVRHGMTMCYNVWLCMPMYDYEWLNEEMKT